MKRLIEKGLMFGTMIRVDSPARITRHDPALKLVAGHGNALPETRHMAGRGRAPW
ncbi:MAG: hypothetical protein Q4G26_06665 [Paracoccus sp. (in: a-proteobacteria)]|nr:hypothetical protein [Paracoccus sp. (in: a-proteobacteria)]